MRAKAFRIASSTTTSAEIPKGFSIKKLGFQQWQVLQGDKQIAIKQFQKHAANACIRVSRGGIA